MMKNVARNILCSKRRKGRREGGKEGGRERGRESERGRGKEGRNKKEEKRALMLRKGREGLSRSHGVS
jgi:hypothetical protein